MNKQLLSPFIYLLLFLCGSNFTNAQEIIWEYKIETPYYNAPSSFWIDENGAGYYNIYRTLPKNIGQAPKHYMLLSLDGNGKFNGAYQVKNCASSAPLLPFGNDLFLSAGNNCDGVNLSSHDNRVYNKKGDLVSKTESFNEFYFARVKGKKGYTLFSDKLGFTLYSPITIGHIDWKFKKKSYDVKMESLKKDDRGLTNDFDPPRQLNNDMWILPLHYGKGGNGSMLKQEALIIAIKKKRIKWKYSHPIDSYRYEGFSTYKNNTAVVLRSVPLKSKLFVLLDENGNVILEKEFKTRTAIQKVILTENNLIILSAGELYIFDLQGEPLSTLTDYQKDLTVQQDNMEILQDGDLIITGRSYRNTFIRRVNISEFLSANEEELNATMETEGKIINQTEDDKIDFEIKSAEIDELAEETISASIYPNPASLFINFEINNSGGDGIYLIKILSSTGQLVHSDSFEDTSYELMLSDFPSGNYFYKIVEKTKSNTLVLSGNFIRIEE